MAELLRLFLLATVALSSPTASPDSPKREFRAVWVTSFHNIDWPSARGLSPEEQKADFMTILHEQKDNGMNALMVQVRPCGDAFYPSQYAPWSEWLTGTQGKAPEPYYDPLAWMIDEVHHEQLEFHAWMNPFRAVSHVRFSSVDPQNVYHKHPEWFFQYGPKVFFNPGIPEVRNYLTGVVMEVVRNYDVDGIHFDDYFYPYQNNEESINDRHTYKMYGGGFPDIHAWRRNNIDMFIQQVSDSIQAIKPHVKFGISPVGIWRNKTDDPRGSNSRVSHTSYDELYADVRKWLERGWIDYVAPQLYWSTDHPSASYNELLPWWAENSFNRHVYIGHAMFKVKQDNSRHWDNPTQLFTQMKMNKAHPEVKGSIFYSANSFRDNPFSVRDRLRDEFFHSRALIPSMAWKDSIPPKAPETIMGWEEEGQVVLSWQKPEAAQDGELPYYYVVYRVEGKEKIDLGNPRNIIATIRENHLLDTSVSSGTNYTYLVTSMDRLHNESPTCAAVMIKTGLPPEESLPQHGKNLNHQKSNFNEVAEQALGITIPPIAPVHAREVEPVNIMDEPVPQDEISRMGGN